MSSSMTVVIRVTAEARPVVKGHCGAEDCGNKASVFNTLLFRGGGIHICIIKL